MIQTTIQVRFADVDRLGHVNNTHIQEYFDLGKTDYFSQVAGQSETSGTGLILANVTTDFHAPAFPQENLRVETRITHTGNKSLTMEQRLIDADTLLVKASCRSVLVAYDFQCNASVEVPSSWKEKIHLHEAAE